MSSEAFVANHIKARKSQQKRCVERCTKIFSTLRHGWYNHSGITHKGSLEIIHHRPPSIINISPSIFHHQSLTINHLPLTTDHRPSTVNRQPSTIDHRSKLIQSSTVLSLRSRSKKCRGHYYSSNMIQGSLENVIIGNPKHGMKIKLPTTTRRLYFSRHLYWSTELRASKCTVATVW